MSQYQTEGAIVTLANDLFGRAEYGPWKVFNKDIPQDRNTLPASSNFSQHVEPYVEAMVLSSLTEQIIFSTNATIVYANDSSAMSGVGYYVVQSITIDKKPRSLPTLGIFTESCRLRKNYSINVISLNWI